MRTPLTLLFAGVLVAGMAPFLPIGPPAHALSGVPDVTTFSDGGFQSGSLRAAVSGANGNPGADSISLGVGTYQLDLAAMLEDANASGDLDINGVLTIVGAGPNATIIDAQSIGERAFEVLGSGQLTLQDLTIRNGSTSGDGGAIRVVNGSTLSLARVVLADNKAVGNGGAIWTNGGFTLSGSTLSGNKTTGGAATVGGAMFFNSATGPSGIDASTFNGNTSTGRAGAIAGIGRAVVITRSTFTGNHAVTQSALYNEGDAGGGVTWLLGHVTVADNTAGSGGALATFGNGGFFLSDVIIAGNTGGQCAATTYSTQNVNIISDATCGASSPKLVVLDAGQEPGLYPLADNGGPTRTRALKPNSPALNVGTCPSVSADQRGIPRPSASLACDAGAYERTIHAVDDPNQMAKAGVTTEIDVYGNDLGTDGYTLGDPIAGGTATIVIDGGHGHASFVSTHVVYTSDPAYVGPDSFRYRICVANACTEAQVDLAVTAGPIVDPGPDPLPQPPDPGSPTDESQYVPLDPTRILDTRTSGTKPGVGSTTVVQITGVAGVPASDVTAAVLNVTATEATAPGYVTVFPTGAERPTASSLNLEYAGQTIPNLVTVAVGADGTVSLFSQSGAHLLVDISGYYRRATDTKSGRFLPVDPTRLIDTRTTQSPLGANSSIDLAVTGVAGVPAAASAVVLNVTATDSVAAGFVTVWPTGSAQPVVSNLNVNRAGQTIANLVIVPVGVGGKISIYSQSGTQIVVDITGWYTDATAEASYLGLFETFTPMRILDTRPDRKLPAGGSVWLPVPGNTNLSAVVLNVTATEATGAGYVTAWPTALAMPLVSNLNVETAGQTIPNAAILGVGPGNSVDLFSQSGTHLVVDLAGWFIVD